MKGIPRNPSKVVALLLLVLILIVAPSMCYRILTEKAAVAQTEEGDLEARNENAFALILGEIRATAADLMFIKTERYLHGGVAYRPHIDTNRLATTGVATAETRSDEHAHKGTTPPLDVHDHVEGPHEVAPGEHPGHEHGECPGGVPTLIRTASEDFRGFLGDLERETKPFRDPRLVHHLSKNEELLPWYRLMTLTDPHNVRGYMIGTMLLTFAERPDEALSFVQEGIEKNRGYPLAFRLYASLTQVYWKTGRLEKALEAARTGYEMGKAVRPEGGEAGAVRRGVKWNDDIENDFLFVARFYAPLLERKGETGRALQVARETLSLAPNDVATKLMIVRLQAQMYIDEGKFDEAIEACRRILAIDPRQAEVWFKLGNAYGKQDKPEKAAAAYEKGLEINPNQARAWKGLGVAYLDQEMTGEAIQAFTRALAINALDAASSYQLSVAYALRGDYALAWRHVHKSRELGYKMDEEFLKALRANMEEPQE